MGYLTALGLAETVPLEEAVETHFRDNCYPPIPPRMAPVAIAAIEAARAGDWSRILELPAGVTTWDGATNADVRTCISNLHLAAFVDYQPATETARPEDEQSPNRGEAAFQETPREAPQQGVEPFRAILRPTGRKTRSEASTGARAPQTATRSEASRSESSPTA